MTKDDIYPGRGVELEEQEGKITPRTQARRVALQGIYQWQMTHNDITSIIKYFQDEGLLESLEFDLFKELLTEVTAKAESLDALYCSYLDREVSRIDPVEKAIMRMGAYELQNKIEIPYKVVINEAVELAKRFGADESHKYVNGILDKAAKDLRAAEITANT